jgi:hypothetical protein
MTSVDNAYDDELIRRLDRIEQPDYDDPARVDLSGREMLVFLVVSVVVMLLVHLWGY